jgi:serine/threonine protein phosphatase PrpC
VADKIYGVLQAWGHSEKGSIRPTNQDRLAIDQQLQLCVIADGLGGHNAGEFAAQTAIEAVLQVVGDSSHVGWPFGVDPSLSEAGNLVRTAIHLANLQVLEQAAGSVVYAGMGTTIVAALVMDGKLSVGHVGDSRLYRLSGGRFRQLTGDDSWVARVIANDPRVNPTLLENHPMRHVLTNVVGSGKRTRVHIIEERLADGDRLLLTTDGVHGTLDDGRLERLLGDAPRLDAVAANIVQRAIAAGSRDNCTAVVARYTCE